MTGPEFVSLGAMTEGWLAVVCVTVLGWFCQATYHRKKP